MAKVKIFRYKPSRRRKTKGDMAAYLAAALGEDDPDLVSAALGELVRAKGMAQIARRAKLGRESLYKALSTEGNPELATILRVVKALGLQLRAVPAKKRKAAGVQALK